VSICWMCNLREANTGEHIFKHTILRGMYGESKLEKGNRLIVRAENTYNGRVVVSKKIVDSTDAQIFKFKNSLCGYCNGSISRAWDDDYDKFMEYLLDPKVFRKINHKISLSAIYGKSNKNSVRNLYNYFCKLFGCLLVTESLDVPRDLVNAVSGFNYRNALGINVMFETELDAVWQPSDNLERYGLIGDNGDELSFRWALRFGPIVIGFWFNTPAHLLIGSQWYGKSKEIPFVKFFE
jgi:hypothetical protein